MFADRLRFLSDVVLDVTLYRGSRRALLVRAGLALERLPPHVLTWLGVIESSEASTFSETTTMIGISAPAVMYDLLIHGFFLIDKPSPPKRAANSVGRPRACSEQADWPVSAISRLSSLSQKNHDRVAVA